jgi:imidazole glycerol-phosphate synthase subunit HisH
VIHIVDYKTGNLGSIKNMLKKLGENSVISDDSEILKDAKKIILPGVGSFDKGLRSLKNLKLLPILNQKAKIEKVPILGICLGAQLMTNGSEEGEEEGLGWVNAYTHRFKIENKIKYKVPHMGWREVSSLKESKLMVNMYENARFYFVHSYHMTFIDIDQVLLTAKYSYNFHAAFENENFLGVQFHPEKSHKYGMKIFKNFIENY